MSTQTQMESVMVEHISDSNTQTTASRPSGDASVPLLAGLRRASLSDLSRIAPAPQPKTVLGTLAAILPTTKDKALFATQTTALAVFSAFAIRAATHKGFTLFSLHVIGEAVFVAALTNAIALPQASAPRARKQSAALHWVLQIVALFGMIIGSVAIYLNKGNRKHLKSIHAWAGLMAIILSLLVAVWGGCARWLSLSYFGTHVARTRSINYHRILGYIAFASVGFTLAALFTSKFFAKNYTSTEQIVLAVCWIAMHTPLWRRLARAA